LGSGYIAVNRFNLHLIGPLNAGNTRNAQGSEVPIAGCDIGIHALVRGHHACRTSLRCNNLLETTGKRTVDQTKSAFLLLRTGRSLTLGYKSTCDTTSAYCFLLIANSRLRQKNPDRVWRIWRQTTASGTLTEAAHEKKTTDDSQNELSVTVGY
jgi:hypothetical protein